jgi:hypothetical protein
MASNCITIINHTTEEMEFITLQDNLVAEEHRKKVLTVGAGESFVIFIDRVETILWEKKKK